MTKILFARLPWHGAVEPCRKWDRARLLESETIFVDPTVGTGFYGFLVIALQL